MLLALTKRSTEQATYLASRWWVPTIIPPLENPSNWERWHYVIYVVWLLELSAQGQCSRIFTSYQLMPGRCGGWNHYNTVKKKTTEHDCQLEERKPLTQQRGKEGGLWASALLTSCQEGGGSGPTSKQCTAHSRLKNGKKKTQMVAKANKPKTWLQTPDIEQTIAVWFKNLKAQTQNYFFLWTLNMWNKTKQKKKMWNKYSLKGPLILHNWCMELKLQARAKKRTAYKEKSTFFFFFF